MPKVKDNTPTAILPYLSHGVDLSWNEGKKEAIGDCVFCGRENKFSVHTSTGEWRCFVCGDGENKEGGNIYTFLQRLWEQSLGSTSEEDRQELCKVRGLLHTSTLEKWGVRKSLITDEWLVPGYNAKKRLVQLYRYVCFDRKNNTWRLVLASSTDDATVTEVGGTNHGMHGLTLWDDSKKDVLVCEGWGDGMCLWEILGNCKLTNDGKLIYTKIKAQSIQQACNVIALPGAGVFSANWAELFSGRRVFFLFDNDHPRFNAKLDRWQEPSGYVGMQRAAKILLDTHSSVDPPQGIYFLNWGYAVGLPYDPTLPEGYDIKDSIAPHLTIEDKVGGFANVYERIYPIPQSWVEEVEDEKRKRKDMDVLPCHSWEELEEAWEKALYWREDLSYALSVLLGVCISTDQTGQQIFLLFIGSPGSGKTRLTDALLVSKKCYLVEHITGFISGWKGTDGKDCSTYERANHKTWITPEGDTVMSSPSFDQLMAQQRRAFDGSTRATYKNQSEDKDYKGLRCPWILAGTPAMLKRDQSTLGDRFLKLMLGTPDEDEKGKILLKAIFTELSSVTQSSNGVAEKTLEPRIARAYRMTGGYVDYLRTNADQIINAVTQSTPDLQKLAYICKDLAEFTAKMRGRPDPSTLIAKARGVVEREVVHTEEQPNRLGAQLSRLALCLAGAMGKTETGVDEEVIHRVTRVALDTSEGITMEIVTRLKKQGATGMTTAVLSKVMHRAVENIEGFMRYLQRLKVVEPFDTHFIGGTQKHYRLTRYFEKLYAKVMNGLIR